MKLYRYYVLAASLQGALGDFVTQHKLIIENLKKKNAGGTRDAVEEHILPEGEKVIKCLEVGLTMPNEYITVL